VLRFFVNPTAKKNDLTRKNWYVSFGSDDRAPHREFATPTRSLRGPKVPTAPQILCSPHPLSPPLSHCRSPSSPQSGPRARHAAGRDRHRRHPGALPPRCQLSLSFGPLPSVSSSYRAKGRQRRFRRSSLSPVAGTTLEMEVDRGIGVRL
jgi:hypothetical protein